MADGERDDPAVELPAARLQSYGLAITQIESLERAPTLVHDRHGHLLFVSKPFAELVGWDCAARLGERGPHPWWPPEEVERAAESQRFYGSGAAARHGVERVRGRLVTADGRSIPIMAHYESIAADAGAPHLHIFVMNPIHELAVPSPVQRCARAPRFDLRVPVSYVGHLQSGEGMTVNVSRAGALVQRESATPGPLPGDALLLAFSFYPGSRETPLAAEVVRATSDLFAVRFVALGDAEAEMLRRALPVGVHGSPED